MPSSHAHQPQNEGAAPTARWWILGLLAVAQSMLIIDVTVLNVALPSIGVELGLDRAALTWVASAYTLLFGSLLLLGGRLADVLDRRSVFLAGLAVFTVASMSSGLATDGTVLLASRIAQGIGAALLSPAALSIVTSTFPGAERTRALAVWAAVGGSGAALGVILGGLLTSGPGWQWIFFINVPIGALVALGVARLVPGNAASSIGRRPVDIPGAIAATAAMGLVLYGLIGAGDAGWTSMATLAPIVLGVIAATVFVAFERRAADPLVRLGMFARGPFSGSLAIMILAASLLAGVFFLASLYLQRMLGLSALDTGLAFLPAAIAIVAGAQLASRTLAALGGRSVAALGLGVAAAGAALLSRVPAAGSVATDVLPGLVLMTFGIGLTLVATTTSAFAEVGTGEAGLASGLVNTAHELGFATGVAVLSAAAGASIGGSGGVEGFQAGFLVAAAGAAIAAMVARVVLPGALPRVERPAFAH